MVIVEPHQHVLEHIHTVLRKERLLTQEWSMLHFDSHPDLACPNPSIPAKACFLPRKSFAAAVSTTTDASADVVSGSKQLNLYEWLDSSSSGIAEWILPLVLSANLSRIQWVKPKTVAESKAIPPPSQLPLGVHTFRVGASLATTCQEQEEEDFLQMNGVPTSFVDLPDSSVVKVDWAHPYYLEDNSTAGIGFVKSSAGDGDSCEKNTGRDNDEQTDQDILVLAQPLELHVTELGPCQSAKQQKPVTINNKSLEDTTTPSMTNKHGEELWSLDICLDYFACHNPFLTDLERKDPVFTRALMDAVYQSKFYSSAVMHTCVRMGASCPDGIDTTDGTSCTANDSDITMLKHYRRSLLDFRKLLVDLLLQLQQQKGLANESNHNTSDYIIDQDVFGKYYEGKPASQQSHPIENLVQAFNASPCRHENIKESTSLIAMTRQALPNLTMPHYTTPQTTATSTLSMDSIRPALERVQQDISDRYYGRATDVTSDSNRIPTIGTFPVGTPPFIITVARSASDGFTPAQVVEELQDEVLLSLHSLYCGCGNTAVRCRPPLPATGAAEAVNTKCSPLGCRFQVIYDYGPWEGATFA